MQVFTTVDLNYKATNICAVFESWHLTFEARSMALMFRQKVRPKQAIHAPPQFELVLENIVQPRILPPFLRIWIPNC